MSSGGTERSGRGAVLGLSFDYHDAAAALVVDGQVVAAAAEERFTRRKHDPSLPVHALSWCLEAGGVGSDELDTVAFYSKPLTTYERILVTHARVGPRGIRSLADAVAVWSRKKLWVAYRIERALKGLGRSMPELLFAEHHESHAASAFLPSPFERAATLTLDGVGEWATASIGRGNDNRVELMKELRFPDSVGLLYSTLTAHCGFDVNDGEYKLMGLAPFGEPSYVDVLRERVVRVADDGSVRLDPRYFSFRSGRRMGSRHLDDLLDGPPRRAGDPIGQREADLARSAQVLLEDIVLTVARHAHALTGERAVCLAGGVALNCVANERLVEEGPFDEVWIQPAAGDDGGALGAALWAWHQVGGRPRVMDGSDRMRGASLGPSYEQQEVADWLTSSDVDFDVLEHGALERHVADALCDGAVVGWFQGGMEFGPRALGHRSILADPRRADMVSRINAMVKQREAFRPFAPAVLAEDAADWFDVSGPRPYMLVTAPVRSERRRAVSGPVPSEFGRRLAQERSEITACTHVDGSARVQTVDRSTNPGFHALLEAFRDRSGCPVLLNTSFNGRDEPIVRSPADALRCAALVGLDLLVIERCIVGRPALVGLLAAGAA